MAKKPTKGAGEGAAPKKASPKRTPPTGGKSKPQAASASPMIDTNIAANAAAALVARRVNLAAGGGVKPESATFRRMKENVSKPHLEGLNSVLESTAEVKRPELPTRQNQQQAHNQTFSADVTRTGVPRRTPG